MGCCCVKEEAKGDRIPMPPDERLPSHPPVDPGVRSVETKPEQAKQAEVIIAVDFGTTFSGFAYVKNSVRSMEIKDNCVWPGAAKAGAMAYCKNQTSLFYRPSPAQSGDFELKAWGWSAFVAYDEAISAASAARRPSDVSDGLQMASDSGLLDQRPGDSLNYSNASTGFFAHNFKLHLAPKDSEMAMVPHLPGNLTPEKLTVDYLRCLADYIMEQLKGAMRNDLSKEDVQWCLTVPAIWDEKAKQLMRCYAEKAGMIQGPDSPKGVPASPRPLHIILEPEAASAYCQDSINGSLTFKTGDRILIADVGGGTIDLVVHEILECDARGGATKVKEVVPSYGAIGGGTFVDRHFFKLVENRISCFKDYCERVNPSMPMHLFKWWQGVKLDFDGSSGYSANFSLIRSGLDEEWQKYDRNRGVQKDDRHYSSLSLDLDDLRQIFDPEVNKVLRLIEQQIDTVEIIVVVGGFASSQYLRKMVKKRFSHRMKHIILPMDPGRAICRGAVGLYMRRSYIQSRKSRRTYGIEAARDAVSDDPSELVVRDHNGEKNCTKCFIPFVKKEEELGIGHLIKKTFFPLSSSSKEIKIVVYSSPRELPKYVIEDDAQYEGSFEVDVSSGMSLGISRQIEVRMIFGDSLITVNAVPLNFGTREEQKGLVVRFDSN